MKYKQGCIYLCKNSNIVEYYYIWKLVLILIY